MIIKPKARLLDMMLLSIALLRFPYLLFGESNISIPYYSLFSRLTMLTFSHSESILLGHVFFILNILSSGRQPVHHDGKAQLNIAERNGNGSLAPRRENEGRWPASKRKPKEGI
jgi:hypothetical protein